MWDTGAGAAAWGAWSRTEGSAGAPSLGGLSFGLVSFHSVPGAVLGCARGCARDVLDYARDVLGCAGCPQSVPVLPGRIFLVSR